MDWGICLVSLEAVVRFGRERVDSASWNNGRLLCPHCAVEFVCRRSTKFAHLRI